MAKLSVRKFECQDAAIADHCLKVDQAAEEARSRFLTSGTGQAMAYQSKFEDASRFLANEAGAFPWLGAEAEIRDKTMREVATVIVETRKKWDMIGSTIEIHRLQAKQAIRDAKTPAIMHAIAESTVKALSELA